MSKVIKTIKRELWLEKIRQFYDSELIKVLLGIRRCGKSVILQQIKEEIQSKGVKSDHLIYINFEDYEYSEILSPQAFYEYVNAQITDEEKYYLFFDEIQQVKDFEKVINSFRLKNTSIFITGSNANLLSSELSTLLSGRFVSFIILPFCFREYLEIKEIDYITDSALFDYIKNGGMPQSFLMNSETDLNIFYKDLYSSIVLKDIAHRYKIQNLDLLDRILEYICQNYSQFFSLKNITGFLKSKSRDFSKETLYNYIYYIKNACFLNTCKRYDLSGKKALETIEKNYLTDLGFLNIFTQRPNIGHSLENIVYNELLLRGFSVRVGVLNDGREIDFIAEKNGIREYYQVAYLISDDKITEREFAPFLSISDNWPKYVLSLDKFNFSRDGIVHKNLLEWLVSA